MLVDNTVHRRIYIENLHSGKFFQLPPEINDGYEIRWLSNESRVTLISAKSGTPQVYFCVVEGRACEQRTWSPEPVANYEVAPDSNTIAYTTHPARTKGSLYDELRNARTGIRIDTDLVGLTHFVEPGSGEAFDAFTGVSKDRLWVSSAAKTPREVVVRGSVRNFHWAHDSRQLSIEYTPDNCAASIMAVSLTSIAVYDVRTERERSLFSATMPTPKGPSIGYSGGEWVRGKNLLLVRRTVLSDPWVSDEFPTWTVISPTVADALAAKFYTSGGAYVAKFFPLGKTQLLVENTVSGVRSLFSWTPGAAEPVNIPGAPSGSKSLFSDPDRRAKVVFVSQQLTRPPEVFIWDRSTGTLTRQTSVNEALRKQRLPQARAVQWISGDGTVVSGWLLLPDTWRNGPPLPLVTLVHGGPTYVFLDSFAPYFDFWPYPLEVYAMSGMAVFIPNYRGTGSYGRDFQVVKELDGEPVQDILSGIESLAAKGIADRRKLAVIGQSHGAWLGPMVLVRSKDLFRASSFAEGNSNMLVTYELYSGILNREVHDSVFGASPYDDPSRYIRLSPDLHFAGVTSANLFEGGAESQALLMLGFGKASRRAGAPTEVIIYPHSSHALVVPTLKRESAERNLHWMEHWLLNDSQTAEQPRTSPLQRAERQ